MIKIDNIKRSFKRRNKNNKERIKFFLEFINNDFIIYDNSIFIKDDNNIVDTLESLGFIKENFVIFNLSHCTYYWEKYSIEVELVDVRDWEIIQTCVEICNLTNYFDLNIIYENIRGLFNDKNYTK